MKELKIYLAGKMSGLSHSEMINWRIEISKRLQETVRFYGCNLDIINPVYYYNFEKQDYQSDKEVKEFDLKHVVTSDIVIVNLDGLNTSDGTKYEISQAARNHSIPVIAFGDKKLYDELHPWIRDDITRVENDMDSIVNYVANFYMI